MKLNFIVRSVLALFLQYLRFGLSSLSSTSPVLAEARSRSFSHKKSLPTSGSNTIATDLGIILLTHSYISDMPCLALDSPEMPSFHSILTTTASMKLALQISHLG